MPEIDRHYVAVFMAANVLGSAEVRVMEPLKCEKWEWISQAQLLDSKGPYQPLFSPLAKMVDEHDLSPLFEEE
ncbi:hypothetical protein BG006_009001 [Podila minutissima]|uniref:Nudix hydrolase domain-containing protein n=1 Tax=Podila minutissima TaxID=64525 RepID=A0A9P5SFC9_9FUNG|nr:hypothetical protein BG006_009001 [Podila minutissima]